MNCSGNHCRQTSSNGKWAASDGVGFFRDAIQHGLDLDLTAWTVNVLGVGIPHVTAVFEDVQRIRDLATTPSSNPCR